MLRLFNWIGTRVGVNAAWSFLSWGLPLAALLVGAAGGGWAAWQLGRAPLRMENADLRESYAEATKLAVLAGARRLQVAQAHSESLATELLTTLADNAQLTQENTHALDLVTTGRACLSGRALSVLNRSPGLSVAGLDRLPPPRPGAAAQSPTAAAHPDPTPTEGELVATDTGIAAWAVGAGAQFEACRLRLDALIAWHERIPTTTTQEPLREPTP